MDRKIMINEIVAAKDEMFVSDPKGNPYWRSFTSKPWRNTGFGV